MLQGHEKLKQHTTRSDQGVANIVTTELWGGGGATCIMHSSDKSITGNSVYTRVLTQIQPGFTSRVNAPNPDYNPD